MADITELTAKLKAAAQEEIMCREACDTSDLWQDEVSPENILALTEALEAKEKQRAAANKVVIQQDIELQELRQRIAELEARSLTVKLPPRAPDNLGSVLDGYEKWLIATTFRDTWNACLSEVTRANAAGISLKIEGE